MAIYNSQAVPILSIKGLPEVAKGKHKARKVLITEENASIVVLVTRKTKIRSRSEGVFLVESEARGLVQI